MLVAKENMIVFSRRGQATADSYVEDVTSDVKKTLKPRNNTPHIMTSGETQMIK